MTPRGRNYVTYFRVSTQRQGVSGLGMQAQKDAVRAYLDAHGGHAIATFTETESGRDNERPQLLAALKRCKQTRATLLVAKLDRLSRNAGFLLSLRDSGVRVVASDLPDMNELTVGILAVVAQHEAQMISERTKAALAAAKARGVKLGNPRLKAGNRRSAAHASKANAAQARERALELLDVIENARDEGAYSLREIAAHLNRLGVQTTRGSMWTAGAVARVMRYTEASDRR